MQNIRDIVWIKKIRLFAPAIGAMLLAVLWTIVILDLDYKREQSLVEARKHLTQSSEIAARKIRSLFMLADVTLMDLTEHWEDRPERLKRRLQMRFESFAGDKEKLGITFHVLPANVTAQQLGRWQSTHESNWFRLHAESASSGLAISKPMRDLQSNETVVLLSRAARGPQGSFLGVAVAVIPAGRMLQFYPLLDLETDGIFSVFRNDGVILARTTGTQLAGADVLDEQAAQEGRRIFGLMESAIRERGSAYTEMLDVGDKIKRLMVFTKVDSYPLTVQTAVSLRDSLLPFEEVRSRHFIGALALTAAILLGLLLFMFYQRFQMSAMLQQQEQMAALESAQESLQRSRENLRSLAIRQQEVVEDERKHISQEIHDELGQRLSLIRLELAMLSTRVGANETGNELTRIKGQTDELIEVVRDVANRMRPGSLEAGLPLAIDGLVQDFARSTGIKTRVKVILPPELSIPESVKVAAFRITQEALTNITRHAQAHRVDMALTAADGTLLMRIKDDGVGFSTDRRGSTSMGVTGMSERALSVGGHISIDSAPGHGTELLVRIPLVQRTEK